MAASKKKGTEQMPSHVSPMLCTLTKDVIHDPDYLYEVKWDGYCIVSFAKDGHVQMHSRSGLDYTKKYPNIAGAIQALGHDVILDGEVVVFNEDGNPDFDALQKYNGATTPIHYCVFDLLWMDGHNLMDFPLVERKALLKTLVKDNNVFQYSESFDDGEKLYQSFWVLRHFW